MRRPVAFIWLWLPACVPASSRKFYCFPVAADVSASRGGQRTTRLSSGFRFPLDAALGRSTRIALYNPGPDAASIARRREVAA
jgi:hypothetical protein